MKSKLLLGLALVACGGLALVLSGGLFGCSTAVQSPKEAGNPDSDVSTNYFNGHSVFNGVGGVVIGDGRDDISSHVFGIEGKVIRIRKTATVLESITIKLIRPLPTALGWIPYEKPGEIIVIHFDESLSKLGSLELKNGSVIRVNFGYIDGCPNWGSNFSWLAVEKNGVFYNRKGEKEE